MDKKLYSFLFLIIFIYTKLLISKGFIFTRYLATEYVEYENETTFIKETSLAREVLNIEDIWTSK